MSRPRLVAGNWKMHLLRAEANQSGRELYATNQAVYGLLRYGVPVQTQAGALTDTVHLIDWNAPQKNHFAIAEEVTLKGGLERRPDIVHVVTEGPLGWSAVAAAGCSRPTSPIR